MVLPATGHLHFLLIVPRICTDNDAPQMTPLFFHCLRMRDAFPPCLLLKTEKSSLILCLISSLCDSSPAIVCVCASSKCHCVQVSAPAIRDHLTFYCDLRLFSWHLPLPQFACWMFHCCGKCQYVCTGEAPMFSSSSSFLFSVSSRACLSKPRYSLAAGDMAQLRLMQIQSMSSTCTNRGGLSVTGCKRDLHISAVCPVGCCNLHN